MKKFLRGGVSILSILLLLCAGLFVSCSDSSDNDSAGGGSSVVNPGTTATVNSVWTFDNQPNGIGTAETAVTAVSLPADSGEGATLSVTGSLKWVAGYLQAKASSNITVDSYQSGAVTYTFTINASAAVKISVDGAGSLDPKRFAVMTNAAGETIKTAGSLASTIVETWNIESLPAGTYSIYMNGSRLQEITASNQTFAVATDNTIANDPGILGLTGTGVVSSDSSVATAAITEDGKIGITSAGAGTCTITVDDGAKHYAKIPVTVDLTGIIAIGEIEKNAFTAQTLAVPAETIAAIGAYLEGAPTTLTSSDESIATVISADSTNVTVTSVGVGTVTVTVAKDTYAVTVPVTVSNTGAISIGKINYPFAERTHLVRGLNIPDGEITFKYSQADIVAASIDTADNAGTPERVLKLVSKAAGETTVTCEFGDQIGSVTVTVDAKGFVTESASEAFTAFTVSTANIANNADTLGIVATSVVSSDTTVVTAAIVEGNIVLTSAKVGEATVTFSDGTNSSTIAVVVKATAIETTVTKWSAATTDTWTFTGSPAWVTELGLSTTAKTLAADAVIPGASNSLNLTLSAAGTGVGATTGAHSFKYHDTKGLCIKKDALKIAEVKGDVTLTINWYLNSKTARNLEVTVGDTGTPVQTDAGTATGDLTPYTVDVTGGAGTNIYIGASDELYIKSITIAEKTAN